MSRGVAAPLLVGLSLPLVACGGAETTQADGSGVGVAVIDAADRTQAAGSARLAVTVEHVSDDPTWGIEAGEQAKQEGVVDFTRGISALRGAHAETVFAPNVVYYRDDNESDRRWRAYDQTKGEAQRFAGFFFRRLDPVHVLRFVASLDDLGPVSEAVGEEEVRGVHATRYRGYVTNEALTELFTPTLSFEDLVGESHEPPYSEYAPLEAWVGDDGLVHKLVYDFDGFGSLLGERTIIELYDFGVDVEVDVPSPDETVEAEGPTG